MNQFHKLSRWAWSILVVCTLAFAMGGCDGKDGAPGPQGPAGADGADGADGATGPQGPPGPSATVTPLESCGVCHNDGSFASAPDYHAVTGVAAVTNVTFTDVAGDLEVGFNLEFDGVAAVGPVTVDSAYIYTAADSTTTRLDVEASPIPVVPGVGAGDFTATISGGTALAGTAARIYLRLLNADGNKAVASGDFPAPALAAVVSDAACTNCHGPKGIEIHAGFGYPGMKASECVVCHKDQNGIWAPGGVPRFDDPFVGIVHGIHNAHNFPSGHYEYDGEIFETTYPTYMNNCSVCHAEPAQLAAANSMPVTAEGCFTCHGSTAGIPFPPGSNAEIVHANVVDTCDQCHAGQIAEIPQTVAEAHNGATTERGGIIWNGMDTAVEEGKKFVWEITSVVDDGTDLTITWQASYNGVGVDPCNATVGVGAPVFHVGNRMRFYRSYAQGDDFIIGASTSAPGQALNVTIDDTNTTCASGIATTVIPADSIVAEKGRLALGGKPLVLSEVNNALTVAARVPTPTFDWLVGDGTKAPMRREIVDTGECLKCHVGSLYQHGGDRVDNVDMCLVCHNAASNEKNVRVGTMGIAVPTDTYDGRSGQTFELKTMLHRIHSAGEPGQPPLVIYRGRGVYAFAPDRSGLANWPGEGDQVVYGSTLDNDGNPGSFVTNHHFHAPTFPRAVNDCAACHVEGAVDFQPDQTKAMASTDDAGVVTDPPNWANQADDVLQGATTTACVTCHADGPAKGHAYQNSWEPQEFPEGRQTIIDAVK